MPLRVCCSFDWDTVAGITVGSVGNKVVDQLGGSGHSIVSTTPRTGTRCLRLNPAAAQSQWLWGVDTLGASQNRGLAGFGLRFLALPGADLDLAEWFPTDMELWFRASDAKLFFGPNGAATTIGPTVVANQWYWVEFGYDCSANPHVASLWVDQTSYGTATSGAAATSIAAFMLGNEPNGTGDRLYDDPVVFTDTVAITSPMGPHKVIFLKADVGGATAQIGTANATGRMVTNSAIDATHNSANILAAMSEAPIVTGGSASGLGQRTSGAGNACSIPMTDYTLLPGETSPGMRILIPTWAAAATAAANTLGVRAFNGTAETILFAAAAYLGQNTAAPSWICKPYVGALTQTEINALLVRIGYSADIAPLPGAHAAYADLVVKEAPAGDPFTVSQHTRKSKRKRRHDGIWTPGDRPVHERIGSPLHRPTLWGGHQAAPHPSARKMGVRVASRT